MDSTTLELPAVVRDRLARNKRHPRQAYHEVISAALDALEAGRGPDDLLATHGAALGKLARAAGITRLWVFGSRARGQARSTSDLDLMYELAPGRSLWDVAGFQADATELVGVSVDVVSRAAVPASWGPLAEAVEL